MDRQKDIHVGRVRRKLEWVANLSFADGHLDKFLECLKIAWRIENIQIALLRGEQSWRGIRVDQLDSLLEQAQELLGGS